MDLSSLPAAGGTIAAVVGTLLWITRSQTKTIERLVKSNGHNGEPNAALLAAIGEVRSEVKGARYDVAQVRERLAVVESRLDHLPGSRR